MFIVEFFFILHRVITVVCHAETQQKYLRWKFMSRISYASYEILNKKPNLYTLFILFNAYSKMIFCAVKGNIITCVFTLPRNIFSRLKQQEQRQRRRVYNRRLKLSISIKENFFFNVKLIFLRKF